MNAINKLFKTAKLIEWSLKYAQELNDVSPEAMPLGGAVQSAQAGDIQDVLVKADLWPKFKPDNQVAHDVTQMINTAKIPEDVSVKVILSVDNKLYVTFIVLLDPTKTGPASALQKLLKDKYAVPMQKALNQAKLSVTDVITLQNPWITF